MATPTKKSSAMENFLEAAFGRSSSIHNNICSLCHKPADSFDDDLSRQEYRISGLCQLCQNKAFADPDFNEE